MATPHRIPTPFRKAAEVEFWRARYTTGDQPAEATIAAVAGAYLTLAPTFVAVAHAFDAAEHLVRREWAPELLAYMQRTRHAHAE